MLSVILRSIIMMVVTIAVLSWRVRLPSVVPCSTQIRKRRRHKTATACPHGGGGNGVDEPFAVPVVQGRIAATHEAPIQRVTRCVRSVGKQWLAGGHLVFEQHLRLGELLQALGFFEEDLLEIVEHVTQEEGEDDVVGHDDERAEVAERREACARAPSARVSGRARGWAGGERNIQFIALAGAPLTP